MGWGPLIDALAGRDRQAQLATSQQLLLGEFVLLLQNVTTKMLPVVIDTGEVPTRLNSWRGRYAELALGFCEIGDKHCKSATVAKVLDDAESAIGKVYGGWKGGDFLMGKGTPIYLANPGEVSRDYSVNCYRMLTGLREESERAVITTALTECCCGDEEKEGQS